MALCTQYRPPHPLASCILYMIIKFNYLQAHKRAREHVFRSLLDFCRTRTKVEGHRGIGVDILPDAVVLVLKLHRKQLIQKR